MAANNRIDPETEGVSPKLFLRIPQWFKDELEDAARDERRPFPDYIRMLLDDAMMQRSKRLRRRRRSLFDRDAEPLGRTA